MILTGLDGQLPACCAGALAAASANTPAAANATVLIPANMETPSHFFNSSMPAEYTPA
jgi:hypothetical protein